MPLLLSGNQTQWPITAATVILKRARSVSKAGRPHITKAHSCRGPGRQSGPRDPIAGSSERACLVARAARAAQAAGLLRRVREPGRPSRLLRHHNTAPRRRPPLRVFPPEPRDPTSLSPERAPTPTPAPAAEMEYEFRGRPGSGSYGAPPGAAPGAGGGPSLYPRVGQPSHGGGGAGTASPRAAPYHHGPGGSSGSSAPIVTPLAPTSSSSSSSNSPPFPTLYAYPIDSRLAGHGPGAERAESCTLCARRMQRGDSYSAH